MLTKLKSKIPSRFAPRLWYHRLRASLWARKYGLPGTKIPVIGITGTDGKTTTTAMLTHILREAGYRVASASTVQYCFGDEECQPPTKKTSQDCREVSRFLKKALEKKCEVAVLEVSSVALDQGRFAGVDFIAAGLTNITPEELRYHGTFAKYKAAKKLLFERCRGAHVFPAKKEFADFAKLPCEKRIIWSADHDVFNFTNSQILLAENINIAPKKISFMLRQQQFAIPIGGDFNIDNALVAIGLATSQGISLFKCAQALQTFTGVAGRLQAVPNDFGFHIFVDYAMTPNGYFRLLKNTRLSFPTARIGIVFGCAGGGRDRDKRPQIGEMVSRHADWAIVTDDESYDEKPRAIAREVVAGMERGFDREIILDRREAIRQGLEKLREGDVLLIPGMGAETSRDVSGTEMEWSDAVVVEEELGKMKM